MFLSDVATAAKQVFILYVLVLLGFICDRTKIYTEKAARLTNDLLFYIVTPAIIIQSFSSVEMSGENVRGMLMSFLGGTILHVVAIVICIPFWRRTDKNLSCIYKYAAIYGNVGYMALPLAEAELGAEGVFFCSGVLIPFNIFAFTHGIYLMSGESAKKTGFNPKWLILNPGVVSVLLGLPLFFFNIRLPSLISVPVNYVAGLNTPLAMIMFGTYLSKNKSENDVFKKGHLSRIVFKAHSFAGCDFGGAEAYGRKGNTFDGAYNFRVGTECKQYRYVCGKVRQGQCRGLTGRRRGKPSVDNNNAAVYSTFANINSYVVLN